MNQAGLDMDSIKSALSWDSNSRDTQGNSTYDNQTANVFLSWFGSAAADENKTGHGTDSDESESDDDGAEQESKEKELPSFLSGVWASIAGE